MEQTDYDSRTALHIAAAEGDTSLLVHSFFNNLGFDIQTRIKSNLTFALKCFGMVWKYDGMDMRDLALK